MDPEAEIADHEERLRLAMLAGDVATLDRLLGPNAVFTSHTGARIDRAGDLESHRSGALRLARIDPLGPALVRVLGDAAVVCVSLNVGGTYAGLPFSGRFAYTRVWRRSAGAWRIEAAHASAVEPAT